MNEQTKLVPQLTMNLKVIEDNIDNIQILNIEIFQF